ncbi:membrane protein complex assembly protein [Schizosaccharomyces japonicus yFS275]|uniref:Cytochrome b mRNA-processing protein 4 n=1 Tax=Schizosaccharomyces japonicus (strain yFS275 / FY16936) TaxID=402676 RepID=B6K4F9_SCHJY|nr:membrane protein complex assembly protein [Schizosaccharomyces japonicus yFS275]EEB08366.1 membrane protein complex assembly protein [Schizosaccharomyces japonicus yFS275]
MSNKWTKAFLYSGLIIGTGYGLLKYTTPTPEQVKESLSPELRKKYEKAKRNSQKEAQKVQECIDAAKEK